MTTSQNLEDAREQIKTTSAAIRACVLMRMPWSPAAFRQARASDILVYQMTSTGIVGVQRNTKRPSANVVGVRRELDRIIECGGSLPGHRQQTLRW